MPLFYNKPTLWFLTTFCFSHFSAVCFKNAKQYEQAKDAYLKEAEYHTENKTYPFWTLSAHYDTAVFTSSVISLTHTAGFFMLRSKYLMLPHLYDINTHKKLIYFNTFSFPQGDRTSRHDDEGEFHSLCKHWFIIHVFWEYNFVMFAL